MFLPAIILLTLTTVAFLGGGIFRMTLMTTSLLLCTVSCWVCLRNRHAHSSSPLSVLTLILTGYIALSALPTRLIPAGMERSSQNQTAHRAIEEAAEIGLTEHTDGAFSISRNRSGTIRILLLLISAFACGFLASIIPDTKRMHFLQALLLAGSIIAVLGITGQWIIPQGKTLWWLFPAAHGQPVACFINRNHFGGYLAMLTPASIALISAGLSSKRRALLYTGGASLICLSLGVIMSLSRGAFISWICAISFTSLTLCLGRDKKRLAAAVISIAFAAAVATAAVSLKSDVSERLGTFRNITDTESASMRFRTWKDALKIISDYPLTGTGANGFRMIFPRYRTESSRKEFKHTENEYIQVPVEIGIVGSIILVGILGCIFIPAFRDRKESGGTEDIIFACGIGVFSAAAAHSALDFTIRVPLYMLTFASLTGLIIKPWNSRVSHGIPVQLFAASAGILATLIILAAGGPECTELDKPDNISSADSGQLVRTLTYAPTSWQAWYHLGNAALASGKEGSTGFGERCITMATEYDPLNYRLWEQLAMVRLSLNDKEGAIAAYRQLKKLRAWKKIPEFEAMEIQK